MKLKPLLICLAIVCLLIPHYAGAATVFETTGWVLGKEAFNYEFVADTAPFTYKVTLSDLSTAPFFGFDFLFLSITTSTSNSLGSLNGPGSFNFNATEGETYSANVFGTGGGTQKAGLFGLEIKAVPIPSGIILLGSSLLGLVFLRRRAR